MARLSMSFDIATATTRCPGEALVWSAYSPRCAAPTAGRTWQCISVARWPRSTSVPCLIPFTHARFLHRRCPGTTRARARRRPHARPPDRRRHRPAAAARLGPYAGALASAGEVAAHDLSLVKLFEGHTDALAILAELGAPAPPPGSRWGTWCAEPPDARLAMRRRRRRRRRAARAPQRHQGLVLRRRELTHAVVSCWNAAGEPCLAAVALAPARRHRDQRRLAGRRHGGERQRGRALRRRRGRADRRARRLRAPARLLAWRRRHRGLLVRRRAGHRAHDAAVARQRARRRIGSRTWAPSTWRWRAAAARAARDRRVDRRRIRRPTRSDVALRARLVVEQAADEVMQHAGRAVGRGPAVPQRPLRARHGRPAGLPAPEPCRARSRRARPVRARCRGARHGRCDRSRRSAGEGTSRGCDWHGWPGLAAPASRSPPRHWCRPARARWWSRRIPTTRCSRSAGCWRCWRAAAAGAASSP